MEFSTSFIEEIFSKQLRHLPLHREKSSKEKGGGHYGI